MVCLQMRNLEKEIERRGVTYSQWKSSAHQHTMDRRGWHPITFDSAKTTLKAIKDIQVWFPFFPSCIRFPADNHAFCQEFDDM
jgi:hypothetical protein